jgi:hypothetical protein
MRQNSYTLKHIINLSNFKIYDLHENKKLPFEHFLFVRSGKLANRVQMNGDSSPGAPEGKIITGFNANKHILLPIPLSEILMNKDAELTQNSGY